jgi:hypothetical protein
MDHQGLGALVPISTEHPALQPRARSVACTIVDNPKAPADRLKICYSVVPELLGAAFLWTRVKLFRGL